MPGGTKEVKIIDFKRNKPKNLELRLIWKQIELKNKEGVVVINRCHPDIDVLNQFDKSFCSQDITRNNFFSYNPLDFEDNKFSEQEDLKFMSDKISTKEKKL